MYLLDWFHWCLIPWNNILGMIVSKQFKLNILRPKELLWTVILATKNHAKKRKIEMLEIADVMLISIWDIGILLFLQQSTLRVNSPKNDVFMFFGFNKFKHVLQNCIVKKSRYTKKYQYSSNQRQFHRIFYWFFVEHNASIILFFLKNTT